MKRFILCIGLLSAFALSLAAADGIKLSMDLAQWRLAGVDPKDKETATELKNVETDGGRAIMMTTTRKKGGVPGLAYTFTPSIEVKEDLFIRYQVRFSTAIVKNWANCFMTSTIYDEQDASGKKTRRHRAHNEMEEMRLSKTPVNEWVTVDHQIHKGLLSAVSIGFLPEPGEKLTAEIRNVELYVPKLDKSILEPRAEWTEFLKNYKPDYSDGSRLLLPPEDNRFTTPLPIVKNGKPAVVIYPHDWEGEVTMTAAKELQEHIRLITGVTVPIINTHDAYRMQIKKDTTPKILIGKCHVIMKAPLLEKELKELSGTDGFVIHREGDDLYVLGMSEKGTLNGVYALLENNTDIIWARPNKNFGTVYTKRTDLDFVWGNHVVDKPASPLRGMSTFMEPEYYARNRCNMFTGGGGVQYWSYCASKKWGAEMFFHRGGHNVGEFIRTKEHPEFVGMINGKREERNWCYCLMNPELKKHFIEMFLDRARRTPLDVAGLAIQMGDTWNWCECERCSAPVKLPDGTEVANSDPAFMSTQMFLFMNDVADALAKEFPGYKLCLLAYFQTAEPPKCEVSPNIMVYYAPYLRSNDTNIVYSPENLLWIDRAKRWAEKTKNIFMYGYDALGLSFPRPLAHTHARDFKSYYRYLQGIQHEGTSFPNLDGSADRKTGEPSSSTKIWDYSAIEMWVMLRLMWNPDQNVEQLYKYFCQRAFREAAVPMEKFYGSIREEWFRNSDLYSNIGENGDNATRNYIIKTGREKEMRGYLEEAEKIVKHPAAAEMVKGVKRRFEHYVEKVAAAKTSSGVVPLVRLDKGTEIPDFDAEVWKKAFRIDTFHKSYSEKISDFKSVVDIFHDFHNIYFRFELYENMENVRILKNTKETQIFNSHFEIFFENPQKDGVYYLLQVDPSGNATDFMGYEMGWTCAGKQVRARALKDHWEAVVKIPLTSLGMDIVAKNLLRTGIVREVSVNDKIDYSAWKGCVHHQLATFGTLTLQR